ncbi:MAG: TPM domain-containing protein [Daejeonella sp.]
MNLFSEEEQKHISEAIESAERFTSGEIRVCVEESCSENVLDRSAKYFRKLNMDQTTLHNGVLIYLSVNDHQFAIIGDSGINKLVPANFWDSTKDIMLSHFKKGQLAEGVIAGIKLAADQLRIYFPYQNGDVNELPNDISFMDGN